MTKEILWAIDFSTPGFEKNQSILPLAQSLADVWDCQIRPTFVLDSKILHTDVDLYLHLNDIAAQDLEKTIFQNFMKIIKSPRIAPGKLIISKSYAKRGQVRSLLEYAQEQDARAILCTTRTRSKFYPSFLGGFTETLLNQSPIPIISSHPEVQLSPKIQKIMYALDLSEEVNGQLQPLIDLAKGLKAQLQIFFNADRANQMLYLAPQIPSAKAYQLIADNEQKLLKKQEKRGQSLIQKIRAQGVDATLILSRQGLGIDESILNHAKNNEIDLIALSSRARSLEGAVFGSVVKEVLRRSPCPVWAIQQ